MIAEKLIALGFEPGKDFVCRDDSDGRGPYIAEWLSDKEQPTQAEIDKVVLPDPRLSLVNAERDRRIAVFINAVTGREHSVAEAQKVVTDGAREATRLLNIKARKPSSQWTPEMERRATELENFDSQIVAIEGAAALIRAEVEAGTYDGDLVSDARWP